MTCSNVTNVLSTSPAVFPVLSHGQQTEGHAFAETLILPEEMKLPGRQTGFWPKSCHQQADASRQSWKDQYSYWTLFWSVIVRIYVMTLLLTLDPGGLWRSIPDRVKLRASPYGPISNQCTMGFRVERSKRRVASSQSHLPQEAILGNPSATTPQGTMVVVSLSAASYSAQFKASDCIPRITFVLSVR